MDFARYSDHHRTSLAHFLNRGKWDDSILELLQNPLYDKLKTMMGIDFEKEAIFYVDSSTEHASVCLANSQYITPDYVIEMGDGSRLSLPMTYQELLDKGWYLEYGEEYEGITDPFPPEESIWCSFINADGETMNAEVGNYSPSKPIALRDAVITQIQVGGVNTESFSLNGISRGASVQEILDEFGLPFGCSLYEWENGGKSFDFYCIDEENWCDVSFEMDPDTQTLDGMSYCVLLPVEERPK